ncbi:MAG: hypothetical protein ABH834_00070 [Candidatus Altiarchaeota archaeon]
MTRHIQKPGGPFEDFRKRFAFSAQEQARALEITQKIYPHVSEDDIAGSGERVHTLLFKASEAHPVGVDDVYSEFGKTNASDFAASLLLAAAYPRWKMEGLVAERMLDGTQTFIDQKKDARGHVVARGIVKADNVVFWPVKKK